MYWAIHRAREGNGWVAKRIHFTTYVSLIVIYGHAHYITHGIGFNQFLLPEKLYHKPEGKP